MRTAGAVMVAFVALSVTLIADARAQEAGTSATAIGERRLARAACITACGEAYKSCVQRTEAKQPGVCGGTAVRCRAACPPRPDTASLRPAAVEPPREQHPDAAAPGGSAPASTSNVLTPAAAPPPSVPPARADENQRGGGRGTPAAAESAPASERPTTRQAREVTPSGRRGSVEPAAAASSPVTSSAAAPPVTTSGDSDAEKVRIGSQPVESAPGTAADERASRRRRRNWLQSAVCVVRACADDEDEPPSCTDICASDYHECVTLGDKQHSLFCATDSAHCRERCADAASARQTR